MTRPFKFVPKKRIGKATVIRPLSVKNFIIRILLVAAVCYVDKHFICSLSIDEVMQDSLLAILRKKASFTDWLILGHATGYLIMQFNIFYVLFYNMSRLMGDLRQFLLSPVFNLSPDSLISTADEKAEEAWKKAGFFEKLLKVEIETECLMPSGPSWLMSSETSSAIWR